VPREEDWQSRSTSRLRNHRFWALSRRTLVRVAGSGGGRLYRRRRASTLPRCGPYDMPVFTSVKVPTETADFCSSAPNATSAPRPWSPPPHRREMAGYDGRPATGLVQRSAAPHRGGSPRPVLVRWLALHHRRALFRGGLVPGGIATYQRRRLLGVGLPLTIVLGGLVAVALFGSFSRTGRRHSSLPHPFHPSRLAG